MIPQELIEAAKCYDNCIPPGLFPAIQTYLMNNILDNIAGVQGGVQCGVVDPTEAPPGECGVYYNRVNGSFWAWNSTTSTWDAYIS